MSVNKKIVIINKEQFGYHTDTFKYCAYLRDEYKITYICLENELTRIGMEGVRVIYIKDHPLKILRLVNFILQLVLFFRTESFNYIFVKYFPLCSLIRPFLKGKPILDIRTGSVYRSAGYRKLLDYLLVLETRFFPLITIISASLRRKLNIAESKTFILPLGADRISTTTKNLENGFRLLYVGTFSQRRLEDTILGFKFFKDRVDFPIKYDIVGSGYYGEEEELAELIRQYDLSESVIMHGRIPPHELQPFFDSCNVGVSYVPITDYYNFQPPTKTFEYVLSGMYCLATNTYENRRIINHFNGILFDDSPAGFCDALFSLFESRSTIDVKKISSTVRSSLWSEIINNDLKAIFATTT